MALVLAFSVQGIAEALTFSRSRSGDLETKAPNEQVYDKIFRKPQGQHRDKNCR